MSYKCEVQIQVIACHHSTIVAMSDAHTEVTTPMDVEAETWDDVCPRLVAAATATCTYGSPRPKTMISDSENILVNRHDIVLARYVFVARCSLPGWRSLLEKIRTVQLREQIYISPSYKECNAQAIVFGSVACANQFINLPPRALRGVHGHGAVMQQKAVFVAAGSIVRDDHKLCDPGFLPGRSVNGRGALPVLTPADASRAGELPTLALPTMRDEHGAQVARATTTATTASTSVPLVARAEAAADANVPRLPVPHYTVGAVSRVALFVDMNYLYQPFPLQNTVTLRWNRNQHNGGEVTLIIPAVAFGESHDHERLAELVSAAMPSLLLA